MLTCREAVARLTDLSCRDLPLLQERACKRHLARCEPCASYWISYRTTVALGREAYREPGAGPGEMPAELVRSILSAARVSSLPVWRLVHLLSGIAAAPLLAISLR